MKASVSNEDRIGMEREEKIYGSLCLIEVEIDISQASLILRYNLIKFYRFET